MNFTHNVVPTVPQVHKLESTNNNALETYDFPHLVKLDIGEILVN